MPDSHNSPTPGAPPEPRTPTWRDRLVGGLVSLCARTVAIVPAWAAYGFADGTAKVLVWVTKRRERRIGPLGRGLLRNQRIVFRGAMTPDESERHLRAWARHMTHSVVDFFRMIRMTPENIGQSIDLSEFDRLRAVHDEGKGVICASGHLGIWELCGHAICLSGLSVTTVYRPVENPAIDRVFCRIRCSRGQELVLKWGALWPLAKTLRRRSMIGIAADENVEHNPTFVPFLGTLAATNSTPALLASRTGSPIVVVSCNRIARGRFRFHIWDIIRVERSPDVDLEAITARTNAALSRAILTYPEQWLWGSRRFTTRPADEVLGDDGLPPIANATANRTETSSTSS